ncbi:MAG: bifunctional diaminohydroxyphosphoribosylaminopyrimidine deaminase/5-amino-6-(5-phosphoribosylamino)uracil reductase RibD [Patescibacteria group bacterium]|nr:bifunctional diaminohydroxyphosphoribosylaminopyrimidine deaminase/5-amino-6-(5-phosphoribosylamino)uracil reductase RibD [Patescibacteria group bacterium]
MSLLNKDLQFMSRCLELARQGLGWVSPNPLVGAVVVEKGKVIGEGFHHQAGMPHAEVEALAACVHDPRRATLYVNLEPCDHEDKKTPPCTRGIIASGVARVVVGMVDPNPKVSGRGIAHLQNAGLQVTVGVLPEECVALNRVFTHWITTQTPYVAAKVAVSRDYKIAAAPGVRVQITGPLAQRKAHELRQTYDAILVGVGTVLVDDPELSVRLYENRPRDPRRIILDSALRLPISAKVLRDKNVLVVTTPAADPNKRAALQQAGILVLETGGVNGRVNLTEVLDWCAKNSITSVMVEGGRKVLDSFLAAGLIQYWHVFVGPKELGQTGLDALSDLSPLQRCVAKKSAEILGPDAYFSCAVGEGRPEMAGAGSDASH